MVASVERNSSTSELPFSVPWLQMVVVMVMGPPGTRLGAVVTEEMSEAQRLRAALTELRDAGYSPSLVVVPIGWRLFQALELRATPERGGRAKLYFNLTASGQTALQASLQAIDNLRSNTTLVPVLR